MSSKCQAHLAAAAADGVSDGEIAVLHFCILPLLSCRTCECSRNNNPANCYPAQDNICIQEDSNAAAGELQVHANGGPCSFIFRSLHFLGLGPPPPPTAEHLLRGFGEVANRNAACSSIALQTVTLMGVRKRRFWLV